MSTTDSKTDEICPCGGGQSCVVDRRSLGDLVVEDLVFQKAGVPILKNCYSRMTKEQTDVWNKHVEEMKKFQSIKVTTLN
jgi:hypothetical protein